MRPPCRTNERRRPVVKPSRDSRRIPLHPPACIRAVHEAAVDIPKEYLRKSGPGEKQLAEIRFMRRTTKNSLHLRLWAVIALAVMPTLVMMLADHWGRRQHAIVALERVA